MSSRVSSCSTSARDSARARSGRGLRRVSIRDGSAAIQPCRIHQAAADLMASRETFHVDGDRPAHRAVNQAANRSGSISGAAWVPNSVRIQRRIRP
jgi:hypothetical protein